MRIFFGMDFNEVVMWFGDKTATIFLQSDEFDAEIFYHDEKKRAGIVPKHS
jgi:hypothetical protein